MVSEVVIASPGGGLLVSSTFHVNRERKRCIICSLDDRGKLEWQLVCWRRQELIGQQQEYQVFIVSQSCAGSGKSLRPAHALSRCKDTRGVISSS